jgi:hypothetical protein
MQSSMARMVLRGGEAALDTGSDEPRRTGSGRRREQRAPRRAVLPRWPTGRCERPAQRCGAGGATRRGSGLHGRQGGAASARHCGAGPARQGEAVQGGAGHDGAGRRGRERQSGATAGEGRGGQRRAAARGERSSEQRQWREEMRGAGWERNRRRRYFKKLTSESVGSARRKLTGRGPVRSRKKPYARSAV